MHITRNLKTLVPLCLGIMGSSLAMAQWTVVDLHPSGAATSVADAISQGQQVGNAYLAGFTHASLWNGTAGSWVDLHPTGPTEFSAAYGASGSQQVGSVGVGGFVHAGLWSGSASSWVDLNPVGAGDSVAFAVRGGQQVGYADLSGFEHASLWSGTAASWVDLQPAGAGDSRAHGVDGGHQVGSAVVGGVTHAILWSGTAASWVDLNPAAAIGSQAFGVFGGEQVGSASVGGVGRAVLWSGTAASWVDLNPVSSTGSIAYSVFGSFQVGYAVVGGSPHASLWMGTSASWVDLQSCLPSNFRDSEAYGVWEDAFGVPYVVGEGYNNTTLRTEALMWTPTRTVAGTVSLQNYSVSPSGVQVTIELRSPGSTTALDTHVVSLDGSGNFAFITNLPPGTYDITAKGPHWLRQRLANETLGIFGVSGLSYSLVNGDVNGDNVISLADFGQLRAAFGSSSGSGNWNTDADLNGDGAVSLADFGVLRANFGRQGDP